MFEQVRVDLQATPAFMDANEAEDIGIGVFLPWNLEPRTHVYS
jgi:hypothetical protein